MTKFFFTDMLALLAYFTFQNRFSLAIRNVSNLMKFFSLKLCNHNNNDRVSKQSAITPLSTYFLIPNLHKDKDIALIWN